MTGGSQGLGLAVAIRLAKDGAASVTIVARNIERLRDATKEIEVRVVFYAVLQWPS